MDDRLQRAPVGVIEVDAEGTVTAINEAACDLIDATLTACGTPIDEVFPRSVAGSLRTALAEESTAETTFEEYYPDLERWLSVAVTPGEPVTAVFVSDVTERNRQAQKLERLQAERRRTAINEEVLSAVVAELVGATSREEIADTICRELGDTDLYEFAWVGERDIGGDELVVSTVDGTTGETYGAVREALDEPTSTPEERALESGSIQVVQPLAEDSDVPQSVRRAGFADGVQSMAAVPLQYGSTIHGVLGIYASGADAFSERERTSFETLGEVAGFAVSATRNRQLLLSDTVTEVSLGVGSDSVLGAMSSKLDASVSLDGLVPQGDDRLLSFVGVDDTDASSLTEFCERCEAVSSHRVISDGGDGGRVELELIGSTPLHTISSLGGTVHSASFTAGRGEIVVEFPPEGDVRRMVAAVDREHDIDVTGKRDRPRSVTTAREVSAELGNRLTDRQETVLRTAYHADYFESPRGSTAEEVAAALDITGSTLLHHLRAAQRKLLTAYFEDDPPAGDPEDAL